MKGAGKKLSHHSKKEQQGPTRDDKRPKPEGKKHGYINWKIYE